MNAPTAKITRGRGAIRFVIGALRMVIPTHKIVGFQRADEKSALYYVDPESGKIAVAEFDNDEEAEMIESWILDSGASLVATNEAPISVEAVREVVAEAMRPPAIDRASEIGPGSLVDYLGKAYTVSREAHSDGVRYWRLEGYTGRPVNESALRLLSPFRPGDQVEASINRDTSVSGKVLRVEPSAHPGSSYGPWIHIAGDNKGQNLTAYVRQDDDILHATRTLPDGTVAILR